MAKHAAPTTRRSRKNEQARPAAISPRPRHNAPTTADSIQHVGGNIEPAPDVRWFGLPWLRSARG